MPKLRDYLVSDIENVFINNDEFATDHNIDGVDMPIIIDNDLLKERQSKAVAEGIYIGDLLFHVKKSDFGSRPAIEQTLRLDGKLYLVSDCQDDEEMYSITLVANQS